MPARKVLLILILSFGPPEKASSRARWRRRPVAGYASQGLPVTSVDRADDGCERAERFQVEDPILRSMASKVCRGNVSLCKGPVVFTDGHAL